jgi:type I restriction enzyme S subunit
MNKATFVFLDAVKQKIDNRGKTPPLSLFGNHMLEVKHIQDDRIYPVLENTKYVSDEVWETWFRQHLLPGDILFSTVGSIGRVCLVPPEPPLCISQNILGFRVDELIADGKFFFYYLKSDIFQQEIKSRSIETVQKSIKFADLKDIPLFLPPLQEQKAIAHILGTLDDKIELNRKTNETLEAMAKALFKSWFLDFDPVRAKAEGRPTGLPSEISDLFPDSFEDSELGDIPNGWEVKALDEIAHFLNGLALQKFPPEDGAATLPVIKIAQLKKGESTGADRCSTAVPSDYVVRDGDVLFSWSGSLAVDIWCGGDGALNQHLFKVTSKTYGKWFFYQWVNHHLPDFQEIAQGKATTMGHIQRHHLSEAKVLIPPPSLLAAMDSAFTALLDRAFGLRRQSKDLGSIRDALLPKLISGEIRIPDAEKMLEEVGV